MCRGVEARRIAYRLASSQLGAVTRKQLLGEGVTRGTFEHWAGSGYLLKIFPSVYTLARPAADDKIMWMAATLFAGSRSALAGSAALAALGAGKPPEQIEVVRPAGHRRTARSSAPHIESAVSVRKALIDNGDVSFIGPVPILEPARLLIDSAGRSSPTTLRRQFIELGRMDHLTEQCIARINARCGDFEGGHRLAFLASCWDPLKGRIRSILEGEFKLLCAERGIPAPLTNHPVGKYEVDALWKHERLVVELDGRRFHGDAFALEADSQKTRHLRSLGYKVLRFTWLEVTERPDWVAARILEALSAN